MNYVDGGVYEGFWIDNKWCGQGELKYPNGTTVKGLWIDDNSFNWNANQNVVKKVLKNNIETYVSWFWKNNNSSKRPFNNDSNI